ncbi:NAD(P)H-quinone oxidoreductase [Halomonas shantousis]
MKAIEITRYGAPDVLQLTRRPTPQAAAGEVLIRVAASGINRPDVFQRLGNYPVPEGITDIPGLEIAGEIVGGDLSHPDNRWGLKVGDRICALVQGGGYAEWCNAPLAQCLPVPEGLSDIEAAALPETFFTVWSNVFERGALGQGPRGREEVLLVQGGSSGIGTTAIQLASALGYRVLTTAGSAEKCRICERLGAERAINYREEDFVEVVKALTADRGADVVLDMVGGSYIARELDCTADDGRIVLIALLGGNRADIPLGDILRRRVTLTGSTLRPRPVEFKAAIAARLKEHVWPLLSSGAIRPVIYRTLPAPQAAAAHAIMESSEHIGKIVLTW